MVERISPSFLGTSVAAMLGMLYVIVLDDKHLHLWTDFIRYFIMGGAAFVLLTYSLSWFFAEESKALYPEGHALTKVDFALRSLAQTILGLSLAAAGINLGVYFWLFAAFIALSFIWSLTFYKVTRKILIYEGINLILCLGYTYICLQLYVRAARFERTYAVMVADPVSFSVRRSSLLGDSMNWFIVLAFVVGLMIANLLFMFFRSPWVRERN